MKPWTVQDEIVKRVRKESDYEWAKQQTKWEVMKVEVKKIKKGPGLWNLVRQLKP